MKQFTIAKDGCTAYPLGLVKVPGGIHLSAAYKGKECRVLFFRSGEEEPVQALVFPPELKRGCVFSMTIFGEDFSGLEYCLEGDGVRFADPYAKKLRGREVWGDKTAVFMIPKALVEEETFDWENDRRPRIPYEESIIYKLHVRGFSMHPSSKAKQRGSYRAVAEKIPYLKELGVTAAELMPVNEFSEIMLPAKASFDPRRQETTGTTKLNYWGYGPGYYFAPKAAYGVGDCPACGLQNDPVAELKSLVKSFHKAGMEVIIELYFTGEEAPSFILDVIRFWVFEFHLDGVHLTGSAPLEVLGKDPYLSGIKLLAGSWDFAVNTDGEKEKRLGEYNDGFLMDMRRVLKGDEGQMNALILRSFRNPAERGIVNYLANTNGFTMMDMVSYNMKHNEDNGEQNRDGGAENHSWNCGVEGPTKRRKVLELRKKQLRNGFLLLFLSQGTPLLLAGDEFGNSQSGNNNAYCQDNELSWLNWNLKRTNRDILDFVKAVIAFRKAHPVFSMKMEAKRMDWLSCGFPDVSYHGVKAWCPEFENFRRQLGIYYCGKYVKKPDGTEDNSFYVAYNMYWEACEFALPNLHKGERWHVALHTDRKEGGGVYAEGAEPEVEGRQFVVPARTIVVFVGKMGEKTKQVLAK